MYIRARGERNGQKVWLLRWERRDPGSGERVYSTETFYGSKRDAERRWIAEAPKRTDGRAVKPGKQTVGEFLTWWLDTYGETNLKPTTLASYRSMAKEHVIPGLGAVALADLTQRHVADWQAAMAKKVTYRGTPISAKRVLNARVMLHAALKAAVRMDALAANPVDKTAAPRVTARRVDSFTREQVGDLMAALDGHALESLVAFSWHTGLRSGETRALRWADVDLDAATALVARTAASTGGPVFMQDPKTEKSTRTIALPRGTVALLRAHRISQHEERLRLGPGWQDRDLVFPTSRGTPMHAGRVGHVFNAARDKAGLPAYPFHALRHTYASLALLAGVPLETVSENLGHRDISFTKRVYAHVLLEAKRSAADMMDGVLRGIRAPAGGRR